MSALALKSVRDVQTPADHFMALVSGQKNDHLLWAKGRKETDGKEWFKISPDWALDQLSQYTNQPEVFITPNEFYGWRYIRLLAALNAFYVDIDVHEGQECPVKAAWRAIDKIEASRLPAPSMVVYTGRGAHLYWLFERTPKQALPRWQLVQKVLVQLTSADKQVMDATRVLRLVGTINTQADLGRQTVKAEILNPKKYQFDWLCDQILKIPRAEIRDIQAARALKTAREPAGKGQEKSKNAGSIYQVWYHRYQDLIKITDAYWFGGVPPGYRNQMLLHMSIALSWFTRSEALQDEILHVAQHHMPSFSEAEVRSTVSSVIKRALHAAEGRKYQYLGSEVDPRYKFKAESLWDIFGDLVMAKPELIPQLRAIIPPEEREKRQDERLASRDRVTEGRYKTSRGTYLKGAETKKTEAVNLHKSGLDNKEIAQKLNLDVRSVQIYLKNAGLSQDEKCAPLVYTEKVCRMRNDGLTIRQIAEKLEISKSTVGRILDQSYSQGVTSSLSQDERCAPLVCGRSPSRSDAIRKGI